MCCLAGMSLNVCTIRDPGHLGGDNVVTTGKHNSQSYSNSMQTWVLVHVGTPPVP